LASPTVLALALGILVAWLSLKFATRRRLSRRLEHADAGARRALIWRWIAGDIIVGIAAYWLMLAASEWFDGLLSGLRAEGDPALMLLVVAGMPFVYAVTVFMDAKWGQGLFNPKDRLTVWR
jgi:hypothetical protein